MSVDTLIDNIQMLSHADFLRFQDCMRSKLGLEITTVQLATSSEPDSDGRPYQPFQLWSVVMTKYSGGKIEAIKLIRSLVPNLGLKEAKEMCDAVDPAKQYNCDVCIQNDLDYNAAMRLHHALMCGGITTYIR